MLEVRTLDSQPSSPFLSIPQFPLPKRYTITAALCSQAVEDSMGSGGSRLLANGCHPPSLSTAS